MLKHNERSESVGATVLQDSAAPSPSFRMGTTVDGTSPCHVTASTLHPPCLGDARAASHDRLSHPRFPGPILPTHRLTGTRSEEHTSELQSLAYLVCRLLLEKKKTIVLHLDRARIQCAI